MLPCDIGRVRETNLKL